MKQALRKITYREIRRSFGRFLAILFIVMLGSGFLAGLRITETDMLHTLDVYNNENNFFDFHIISTLGLTEDDVQSFADMDGVYAAEGAVSTDAIFSMSGGKDYVLRTHSMSESVDVLKLRSGRLPQSSDECVLDAMNFSEDTIGTTITLADGNDSDRTDMFTHSTYKVVGLVNSPLYINFTRGTTSLGSGSVKGFAYIPSDGYTAEYFTEAWLRLDSTGGVYTQQYDDAIDAFRDTLTDKVQQRADLRYEDIVSEANGKYSDALKEYNDGVSKYNSEKTKAENKLSDAKAQLDASSKTLADSRKKLDNGWAQLKTAQAQLDEKKAQFDASAADTQAKLDASKAQLDSGWAQYNAGIEQYNAAVSQYGEAAMAAQKAQLDATKQQLDAAQTEYNNGAAQFAGAKQQLAAAQAQIDNTRATLTKSETQYADGLAKLKAGKADYESAKAKADKEFSDSEKELNDGKTELSDAKKDIDGIEKPTVYVLDRYTNTGYSSFKSDSSIVAGIAKVFPIFFFLVAALVCVTTMNRMVDEQRTQIGTLKSLGYTPGEIMQGYLMYSGLASGIGSVIGVTLGSIAFPKIIWKGYNIMYDFTDILLTFDIWLYVLVCGAFIACSLLVTWISCRHELREAPAELVRPMTPKAGKRILLEKIPFIWNSFSFLRKVSARNIFRYKKRMFMMIIGIAGCTALLLTAFGLNDSIAGLADTQYENISIYDAQVNFKNSMNDADKQDFLNQCGSDVTDAAFLSMYTVDAKADNGLKTVYLVGTDEPDMSKFMNYELDGQVQAYPGYGEVLINDNLARVLGVKVGDSINLQNTDMDTLSLRVSGIYYNVIYNYAYVSLDTLRDAKGFDSDINAAFLNFSDSAASHETSAKVSASDYVMSTSVNDDSRQLISRSLESMMYIVGLVSFCAGALAFIVLYNLTNINITERLREIATIKVLGFRQWETASYVFRENMILTLMGTVAGIPLGIWLHNYVMSNIQVDMISYTVQILWPSYVVAILLTLLFAVIVDFFMYFKLDKINMAESLKSVE